MKRNNTILFSLAFSNSVLSCEFDWPNSSALAVRAQRIGTRFNLRRSCCVSYFYTFSLESRRFRISATGDRDCEHGRGPTSCFVTTAPHRRKRTGDAS